MTIQELVTELTKAVIQSGRLNDADDIGTAVAHTWGEIYDSMRQVYNSRME